MTRKRQKEENYTHIQIFSANKPDHTTSSSWGQWQPSGRLCSFLDTRMASRRKTGQAHQCSQKLNTPCPERDSCHRTGCIDGERRGSQEPAAEILHRDSGVNGRRWCQPCHSTRDYWAREVRCWGFTNEWGQEEATQTQRWHRWAGLPCHLRASLTERTISSIPEVMLKTRGEVSDNRILGEIEKNPFSRRTHWPDVFGLWRLASPPIPAEGIMRDNWGSRKPTSTQLGKRKKHWLGFYILFHFINSYYFLIYFFFKEVLSF